MHQIGEEASLPPAETKQHVAATAPHVRLIGVGGIASTEDARERLAAGAHHIQIATAAMLNPLIGIRMRAEMANLAPATL